MYQYFNEFCQNGIIILYTEEIISSHISKAVEIDALTLENLSKKV